MRSPRKPYRKYVFLIAAFAALATHLLLVGRARDTLVDVLLEVSDGRNRALQLTIGGIFAEEIEIISFGA